MKINRRVFIGVALAAAFAAHGQTARGFSDSTSYRLLTDGFVFRLECQRATNDWWATAREFRTRQQARAFRDAIVSAPANVNTNQWYKVLRRHSSWTNAPAGGGF